MTTVRHEDIRSLGFCNRGSRQFFERHKLSWPDFLAHGIDAAELVKLGDAMAEKAIEQAQKRESE